MFQQARFTVRLLRPLLRPSLPTTLKRLPFPRRTRLSHISAPRAHATALSQDLEDFLQTLVEIESPTQDATGVNRVQDLLAAELLRLGFQIVRKKNPSHVSGDLLIATLQGEDPRFITFVSHADTVLSPFGPTSFERLADGVTARGSGVIDNKGGLTVLLNGIALYLQENPRPRFSLRVVISPNEEVGSPGFTEDLRSFAPDSVMALGFEPALEDGSIIRARRGNRWYHVKVLGTEGHAGRSRGEHVNAAHEIAIKIAKLCRLTDHKKGIAVNIGRIEGGRDKFNVICGHAEAKIDARFTSFTSRNRLHKQIVQILEKNHVRAVDGAASIRSEYSIVDDCPPFSGNLRTRGLLGHYISLIQLIEGRTIRAEKAGGAGDVSYMSHENIVIFDGLGPTGGKMHTEEEFVHLPSLRTRSQALAGFLEHASRKLK